MASKEKPQGAAIYECEVGCGACCRHLFVYAEPLDAIREPRIAALRKVEGVDGPEYWLNAEVDWTAEHGAPCHFIGCDNLCQIYPTRPQECVAFEAGGELCQHSRDMAGLPPLQPAKSPDGTFNDQD